VDSLWEELCILDNANELTIKQMLAAELHSHGEAPSEQVGGHQDDEDQPPASRQAA
jgi:hypothetical protein